MRGFQLWINLPANEKMKAASYRDISADEIPVVASDNANVRVIAGTYIRDGQKTTGPIQGLTTAPVYFDVALLGQEPFRAAVPAGHNVFLYVYEGSVDVGQAGIRVNPGHAALLGRGDTVAASAADSEARFLLIGGTPLNEPVTQYGPFVMNTREEIEQALADYRDGTLAV